MKNLFKISGAILIFILIGSSLFLINSCKKQEDTFTDIDGNLYNTVTIGTQTWMVENLKTTKLNEGTAISYITDNWNLNTQPAYCWYNNDATINKDTYGALYNWYTVASGKLCPKGWHVASKNEWKTLITYLVDSVASGKLRESGTTHWTSPNEGANNSSGFTALPGGRRDSGGSFSSISTNGFWWSSTEEMAGPQLGASTLMLYWLGNGQVVQAYDKKSGFSVRCIRDN